MTEPAFRDPLVGTTLGDRYEVLRLIGGGGMGQVYVARHLLIGRYVAIKVLHPEHATDGTSLQRFVNEGRAAGLLGHPNIVEFTDMGYTSNGLPFLVMELLEGLTLAQVIGRDGMLPIGRAVRIALQIASALGTAHGNGIVHRDLKSDNVFLVDLGGDDHVKVIDFGISKFIDQKQAGVPGQTKKGVVIGTPDFMAPEQIRDPAHVDGRADVYALGVILYHMLAGQLPFEEVPFPLVLTRILDEEPPPVTELRPNLPAALADVVARAMAKEPDARYQDMDALAGVLRACCPTGEPRGDEPAGATPVPRRRTPTPGKPPAGPVDHAAGLGLAPTLQHPELAAAQTGRAAPPPVEPGLVTSPTTAPSRGRSAIFAAVAVLAVVLAGVAVVASRQGSRSGTTAAAAVPTEGVEIDADRALALYLDEAERLAGERKYAAALEMLERARAVHSKDPTLNIRLARLTDAVETGTLRASARHALAHGDRDGAADAARRILERHPEDAEAAEILAAARRPDAPAPPDAGPAVVAQAPSDDDPRRTRTNGRSRPADPASPVAPADPAPPSQSEPKPDPEPQPVTPPVTPPAPPPEATQPPPEAKPPAEPPGPRLPAKFSVTTIKELTRALSIIEQEAIDRGGVDASVARGVTTPLAKDIFEDFSPGQTIAIHPRTIYWTIVNGARAGKSHGAIAGELRRLWRAGKL